LHCSERLGARQAGSAKLKTVSLQPSADRHPLQRARSSSDEASRRAFEPTDRIAAGIASQARPWNRAGQRLRGRSDLRRHDHCTVAQVAQATCVIVRVWVMIRTIVARGVAMSRRRRGRRLGDCDIGRAARHFHRRDRQAPQWQQGQNQPDDPMAASHQYGCRRKLPALLRESTLRDRAQAPRFKVWSDTTEPAPMPNPLPPTTVPASRCTFRPLATAPKSTGSSARSPGAMTTGAPATGARAARPRQSLAA
jgi:hypothetical protein